MMRGTTTKESETLITPSVLRSYIKRRSKFYILWLKQRVSVHIPDDRDGLDPKYSFMFGGQLRYLNFHLGIMYSLWEEVFDAKVS